MHRIFLAATWAGLLMAACLATDSASAQEIQSFNVSANGVIGQNQLGVEPGAPLETAFMLDPDLAPTLAVSTDQVLRFIDPWRWHWVLWDWLRVFIVEQPRFPIPIPDPAPWRIRTVFDDSQDMVMPMPGSPPIERGTTFLTTLNMRSDSAFLREERLPTMQELSEAFVAEGSSFMVLDPQGEPLLEATIDSVKTAPSEPVCEGDTDGDGDVDGTDAGNLRRDFGRVDCPLM